MKALSKCGNIVGILREKEIFNEIGFIYALPCSSSFVTTEDTVLVIPDKKLIENISKTDLSLKNTVEKLPIKTEKQIRIHRAKSKRKNNVFITICSTCMKHDYYHN